MERPKTTSVEDAIKAWVDEVHMTTKRNHEEILDYNIRWKKVSIKHHPTVYDTVEQTLLQGASIQTNSSSVQVLCQSSLENKTDRDQIKLFRASQSTRSVANFHMDKNVQFAPGFKFTPPGVIIKATKMAEIDMGDNENTFSEEITWEVKNSVHVGPHKKVVCQLAVEKYINQGRFTHMVDLVGEISVVAKLSDGSMRTVYGDVRKIFKSLLNGEVLDDRVRLKVTGQAAFHFGVRQHVLVSEKDLDTPQARPSAPTRLPDLYTPHRHVQIVHVHPSPQPQPSRRHRRVYRAYRAVGLELANGDFEEVIPKNALLPITERYEHPTARFYQTKSEFDIYEGNHHIAENNEFLACLELYKEKYEPADIVITFRLEQDGTLYVTAKDRESGEQDQFEYELEKVKTYWQ